MRTSFPPIVLLVVFDIYNRLYNLIKNPADSGEEGLLRYGNDRDFTVMQSTFTGDMRQCDRIMMKGRFHHRMVRDQE
ncbi:hypothetical protein QJS10_CPA10g00989 [Acorus calamus]|uniref:Uncharacterized protein n=1 Tax=Acorus calamus TaxID=4465 RepID=A0AAV9E2W0_ACOCL|nr:hypothetical protein QJS10_CPA10g00989 [Acorus calamus]